MHNNVTARFVCQSVTEHYNNYRIVTLTPVYSSDPQSPNYTWSKATPNGKIELTITNPNAEFVVGNLYHITFDDLGKYDPTAK